ncbi:UDP-N-acetylmuramoyl-tripeptide--D-alanyl-D-alanine ligase [Marinomonas sp. C2222]|uniref:UDP-N-acetylmuramoyl-tripeptide--D-alanyl-D-alanine ligase n=1 Tax=Marinomonas sargassi TaxID=2984494 RepID=A0ABT2YT71_9GAMM|nr:UDP-N-acetylmuramoyl-tripeptide--D-alanyl-D-alanine ligase [Marinomonas sargassi]MCV2403087.1 UDP-N-acetylmuramoyl-tripeptide--D-alanyl-D-alanine ligase [Marinomonas sargassi]
MLLNLTLADIASACNGQLVGTDKPVSSVVTDTRKIVEDCLFVALKGERFDGHDYVLQAVEEGAASVVSEKGLALSSYIKVEDTKVAYGCIARLIRDAFQYPVICITGSNGKTTVKDWLSQSFTDKNVLKTQANLNNQIGVPQTLLGLEKYHELAVVETGTSVPGEIARLASIAHPDVVVLTNASGSHFEGFGDLAGIAQEKGNLISGAATTATVILNADDGFYSYWCELAGDRKVVSFGFNDNADLYAYDLQLGANESQATFRYQDEIIPVTVAGAGKHMIANGMSVALAMMAVGVSFTDAVAQLAIPVLVSGRLERLESKNGALLINDCYNASPKSVEAAIDVLAMQDVEETWLILGALGELGALQDEVHRGLGIYAKSKDISHLICVGPVASIAGAAYDNEGGKALLCNTHEEAAELVASLGKEHAILVKGSRSAKMENVISALK